MIKFKMFNYVSQQTRYIIERRGWVEMINASYKCTAKKLVLRYANLNLGSIIKVTGFFLTWSNNIT